MEFPSRYKLDVNRNPRGFGMSFEGVQDMTRQEFKDECDINVIMSQYVTRGIIPVSVGIGTYGDFSEVGDYMEAQQLILRARAQFDSLDAKVRERFGHDPAEFLKFITDKSNLDEARKLGLLKDVKNDTPAGVVASPPSGGDNAAKP